MSEISVGDLFTYKIVGSHETVTYEVRALDDSVVLLRDIEPLKNGRYVYAHDDVRQVAGGGRYKKVEPFFEVGKTYRWPGSFDQWTVHSIAEHNGSKAAVVYLEIDHTTDWTTLRTFSYYEEVND